LSSSSSSSDEKSVAASGPFHTSERRGGVQRRQLELKGVAVGN
jgi:hypothetical protein